MRRYDTLLWLTALAIAIRLLSLPLLPLVDTTEGRYAVVAQEMALSGDWTTPKVWIDGELIPFLGKPPLFFWLAAGGMKVFGINEFAARLPSWLAMVGLLVLMELTLRRVLPDRRRWLAIALTATCPVFLGLGGAVATDMLLASFVGGSVLAYLAFASEEAPARRARWSLVVFVLLAGGFLTKGPVALVLFGLPVLAWTILYREWGLLRHHAWGRGVLVFLLLVVPWFWLCESRNPGFLHYFFVNENLLRFASREYGDRYGNGHVYPRGSALVMLLIATLPWSLFSLPSGWRHRHAWSRRPDRLASLLLLGFALPTLFWCLARQLLITYLLPMVPLFCAWLAMVLPADSLLRRRPVAAVGTVFALVALLACALGPAICHRRSAKGIVACAEKRVGSMAVFSRNVPYSAYFYGRGSVLPHPKWSVPEASVRVAEAPCPALLVVKRHNLDDLPAGMSRRFQEVGAAGDYVLLATSGQPRAAGDGGPILVREP